MTAKVVAKKKPAPKKRNRALRPANTETKPAGVRRATDYTSEIGDQICLLVADRSNLHQVSLREDMPGRTTIYQWLKEQPQFKRNYEAARLLRADSRADHIDDIVRRTLEPRKIKKADETGTVMESDNPEWLDPQAARVAIDAEKWQAGKENSSRYGDRVAVTGANGGPLVTVALEALKDCTDEELEALERIHAKLAAVGSGTGGEETQG